MHKLPKVFAAGAVIFKPSNRAFEYLLLKNSIHKTWAPPKGHLEEGEDIYDCAIREIKEEIGKNTQFRIIPGFQETLKYEVVENEKVFQKEVTYFLAELTSGEIIVSNEHEDWRWVTLEEAESLLQYDDLKELLRKADMFLRAKDVTKGS